MKNKYVCVVDYFPNCRGHEGGLFSHLKFLQTIDEIKDYALSNIKHYAITDIYDAETGELVPKFEVNYEISNHKCNGILIKYNEQKFRTLDDGQGKLKWLEE